MADLRIIFMGTAELSCASLRALLRCPDFEVAAVVTQPDQPKGRGLKLQGSPVKTLALEHHCPVLQPAKARDDIFLEQVRALRPDLIVVTAYGQILPESLLELPPFGCVNVHTSLLPKYRGAAPIQWALLNGELKTGVTIMKMDSGMDTGDILTQESTVIEPDDNAQTLHDRLGELGAELLLRTIPAYVAGQIQPRPQPAEGVSYAPKIRKQDGHIRWNQPATAIWNQVRGLVPSPGAFTYLPVPPGPQRLKIWHAEAIPQTGETGTVLKADKDGIVVGCGAGSLRILRLQREGGRPLSAREFLAGNPLETGRKLQD